MTIFLVCICLILVSKFSLQECCTCKEDIVLDITPSIIYNYGMAAQPQPLELKLTIETANQLRENVFLLLSQLATSRKLQIPESELKSLNNVVAALQTRKITFIDVVIDVIRANVTINKDVILVILKRLKETVPTSYVCDIIRLEKMIQRSDPVVEQFLEHNKNINILYNFPLIHPDILESRLFSKLSDLVKTMYKNSCSRQEKFFELIWEGIRRRHFEFSTSVFTAILLNIPTNPLIPGTNKALEFFVETLANNSKLYMAIENILASINPNEFNDILIVVSQVLYNATVSGYFSEPIILKNLIHILNATFITTNVMQIPHREISVNYIFKSLGADQYSPEIVNAVEQLQKDILDGLIEICNEDLIKITESVSDGDPRVPLISLLQHLWYKEADSSPRRKSIKSILATVTFKVEKDNGRLKIESVRDVTSLLDSYDSLELPQDLRVLKLELETILLDLNIDWSQITQYIDFRKHDNPKTLFQAIIETVLQYPKRLKSHQVCRLRTFLNSFPIIGNYVAVTHKYNNTRRQLIRPQRKLNCLSKCLGRTITIDLEYVPLNDSSRNTTKAAVPTQNKIQFDVPDEENLKSVFKQINIENLSKTDIIALVQLLKGIENRAKSRVSLRAFNKHSFAFHPLNFLRHHTPQIVFLPSSNSCLPNDYGAKTSYLQDEILVQLQLLRPEELPVYLRIAIENMYEVVSSPHFISLISDYIPPSNEIDLANVLTYISPSLDMIQQNDIKVIIEYLELLRDPSKDEIMTIKNHFTVEVNPPAILKPLKLSPTTKHAYNELFKYIWKNKNRYSDIRVVNFKTDRAFAKGYLEYIKDSTIPANVRDSINILLNHVDDTIPNTLLPFWRTQSRYSKMLITNLTNHYVVTNNY